MNFAVSFYKIERRKKGTLQYDDQFEVKLKHCISIVTYVFVFALANSSGNQRALNFENV